MIAASRYLFIHDARADSATLRESLIRQWKDIDRGVEYDFYAAGSPEDALRHVSLYCDLHPGLDTCFVACGGDALTAGVASGLMGADEGKTLAVWSPDGSDSLARYYEGRDFGSVARLLAGDVTAIDMIRINNAYAVNACTFGLEELAEGKGLLRSLSAVLRRSFSAVHMTADGVPLYAGNVLILTLANGRYGSGGLFCAPQAVNDDGKLDLCAVRNMPPTRLMKLLPLLEEGKLGDDPAFAADIVLRRAAALTIESSKDLTLYADGLPLTGKQFNIRVIPAAVRLVVPAE